jgi:ribosomal protein L9
MGRAENRKMKKNLKKGLTNEQFQKLQSQANKEIVQFEVSNQIKFYKSLWTECLLESFKKNGISNDKAKMFLDDVEIIMRKKVSRSNE